MTQPDFLYRPPGSATHPGHVHSTASERRNAGKVFVSCVVGGSLFVGTINCIRAWYALRNFGVPDWAAGIVAVGALRLSGAAVVASAAGVAFVTTIHRRATANPVLPRTRVFWLALFILPIMVPSAASVMVAAAMGTASLCFDIPIDASWARIRDFVSPTDPLVGAAVASLFALVLGGTAPEIGRLVAGIRGRLIAKIVIMLVVTQVMATIIDGALTAVLSLAAAPGTLR